MDREKVIKGLECCASMNGNACGECPYSSECVEGEATYQTGTAHLAADALALLKEQENIETLTIRNIVPNYLVHKIEFVKTDMANRMARKLVAEGFMEFFINEKYEPMDVTTEIEARIRVEKPIQESR